MSRLISLAEEFNTIVFVNKKRKFTNENYSYHGLEVKGLVECETTNEDVLASAILHDVLEDTKVSHQLFVQLFGTQVLTYVREVSKNEVVSSRIKDRHEINEIYSEHLMKVSDEAKLIKCADIISNCKSIVTLGDIKYAEMYLNEKMRNLSAMNMTGTNFSLYTTAWNVVDKGMRIINKLNKKK